MAAVIIGGMAWGISRLAGTTEGVRWLMDAVSRHTPVEISARQVEGRLLDRLHLEGVHIVLTPVAVDIGTFDFAWQPFMLLSKRIAVTELVLKDVEIRDDTPKGKPPDLAWPRASAAAVFFDGRIGGLRVEGLTYRRLDDPPLKVTTILASATWREALLSVTGLSVASPAGRLTGSVAAGFYQPSLRFDLTASPAGAVVGMDAFSLQGLLVPGLGQEQLAGSFTLAGASGKAKRLELAGEAGMTRRALNVRKLRLTQAGRRGEITGEGTVTPTANAPFLELKTRADGLNLAPELKIPTDLSGTLTLTGTPERYRGEFRIENRGKGWRTAGLSGEYDGNSAGVRLAPLTGSLLAGVVRGGVDIGWRNELSLSGTLRGRHLNPAGLAPDWQGVVNFDLAGSAAWRGQGPARGEVKGRLLESRLHGQALTGEFRADFTGDDFRIGKLALKGKGFDISAAGDLGKRLGFVARVADLGRLVPRAAGEFLADGWVSWHDGRPGGSVTGRGVNLSAGGVHVAGADLTARLGEGKGYPVHIAATLRKAAYEGFQADSVTLEADGTALKHTVKAELRLTGAEAAIGLTGSYDRGKWQGAVVRFSGRDGFGPWDLAAPAPLSVHAGRIALSPLVITGRGPERIEVAGELTLKPLDGSFRGAWRRLNLARAKPWLSGDVRLEGRLSGNATGTISSGGRVELAGQAFLNRGRVRWQKETETLDADVHAAELSWDWQGALQPPAPETHADRLVVGGRALASGVVTVDGQPITVQQGSLTLDGDDDGLRAGAELQLAGGGGLKGTFTSAGPVRLAIPETGELSAEWTGIDLAMIRRWLPGDVRLAGRLAGHGAGKFLPGNRLGLTGKTSLSGGRIGWQKERGTLDADLGTAELSWDWQGPLPVDAKAVAAGRLIVAGRIGATGALTVDGRRIGLDRISLSLDGNERGIRAEMLLALAGGGVFKGRFTSPGPAGLSVPEAGEADLLWSGIDLALVRPWLPKAVNLEGRVGGRATGDFQPGKQFAAKGDIDLSEGKVRWFMTEGEINLNLRAASLAWEWGGEALRGTASLGLAEHGQLKGSFQLPLPARLPVSIDGKGPLRASLTGRVQEKGILASLFPGLIRESRGDVDVDLKVAGTWEVPEIEGGLKLSGAGAYLPTAGIHVKDVQLGLSLEKDLIRIDSFRAVSGPGHIEGTALVRLRRWQVVSYGGSIKGERFQTIYLPELQLLTSPRLTFDGDLKKLAVRGEVLLPEMLIFGPPTRAVVLPSGDVVLEGAPKPSKKDLPLALDAQVRLTVGEKVLVRAEGIDAQLGGGIDLVFQSIDRITSKGEIRVVKGRYKAYGAELDIVRGRLYYAGGPINQPTLDILALRTAGEVRAGVTVAGVLRAPVIKLYSEPAMPDVDILSYILFGHAVGTGGTAEQAAMMAQMASALLSRGQSVALQEQIKNRLGLSTLEIRGSDSTSSGLMGYKELPVAPAGVPSAKTATTTSEAIVTVGKYLTPQLYFSYGRSLFTGSNLFRLRYDLFKQWQIETQTGSESGVDLYYKIEFN